MSSYISCYNMNRELEHFEVPEPVYVYIIQLENEIRYGSGGVNIRDIMSIIEELENL